MTVVKKEQSLTFYNTTGVIERDKNIYYSPLFKTYTHTSVREEWLALFNTVCLPDANYTNRDASGWLPQDRKLRVRGNVDDFRLISEEGSALNYFILDRQVTYKVSEETQTVKHYYYAFFINNVRQAGQGSVELDVEPDHFTNVFFLHNEDTLVENYDAFNKRMSNCYIARQHYDRVKWSPQGTVTYVKTQTFEETNHEQYNATFTILKSLIEKGLVGSYDYENINFTVADFDIDYADVTENETSITIDMQLHGQGHEEEVLDVTLSVPCVLLEEANLDLFSQVEEAFKYKRQLRDYKEPLIYDMTDLSEQEKSSLKYGTWNELSDDLKIKAIKLSLAFMHVISASDLTLKRKLAIELQSWVNYRSDYHEEIPNVDVNTSLYRFVAPIFKNTNMLSNDIKIQCRAIIDNFIIKYTGAYFNGTVEEINDYTFVSGTGGSGNNTFDLLVNFSKNKGLYCCSQMIEAPFSSYVLSAYVTKEASLLNHISFYSDRIEINSKPFFFPDFYSGFTGLDILQLPPEIKAKIVAYTQSGDNTLSLSRSGNTYTVNGYNYNQEGLSIPSCPVFAMFSDTVEDIGGTLDLRDKVKNPKTDYYDVVLSFNPYSFWSISYLGEIEVPLNKNNYYENEVIEYQFYVNCSDTMVYTVLPEYTVEGKDFNYYSEQLKVSLSCSLTINNDKLSDYVIANSAQMKNQFAVNTDNFGYGLMDTFTAEAIGVVGGNAIKGGMTGGGAGAGAGAILGSVQQISKGLSQVISFAKNNGIISRIQHAKLADMGKLPDTLKQVGTNLINDLSINEIGLYKNHYKIDEVSYNSICKYLERFGYLVNIYDILNVNNRVGWNYIELLSFDYDVEITVEQENGIRKILQSGVTLLHDKNYLTQGHNFETILEEEVM